MDKESKEKLLVAETIIQLETVMHYKSRPAAEDNKENEEEGSGYVNLENALAAFSVELLIYAMEIPAIHERHGIAH